MFIAVICWPFVKDWPMHLTHWDKITAIFCRRHFYIHFVGNVVIRLELALCICYLSTFSQCCCSYRKQICDWNKTYFLLFSFVLVTLERPALALGCSCEFSHGILEVRMNQQNRKTCFTTESTMSKVSDQSATVNLRDLTTVQTCVDAIGFLSIKRY